MGAVLQGRGARHLASHLLVSELRAAGHEIEVVEPFSDLMGHAGAIVRHVSGVLEGAADPRSDGAVCAW